MPADLKAVIHDLEISLLTPEVRASARELDRLLADEFLEFGRSGATYDKRRTIELLVNGTPWAEGVLVASEFQVRELADGVVLATFKTARDLPGHDRRVSLRASIWKRYGDRWQLVFHQGTPVK